MRERVNRAAGQQMRLLRMPINVGDAARVRTQTVDESRIALGPRHHLNGLAGRDGTVFLAVLANRPFGCRHFVFGVSLELVQRLNVAILFEALQGQVSSSGEQHPISGPVHGHGGGLKVAMLDVP
jgi:hypothetical protein